MIDFTMMEVAQAACEAAAASMDATVQLARMQTDKVVRQLIDHIRAGRDVHVQYSWRDGYITADQAREVLRSLLDSVSPEARAEAESVLGAP